MADERFELPVIEQDKPRISTNVRAVGKDSRTNSAASSSVHFSPISYNTCNTESTFVSPGLLRQNSVRERPALQGYPKLARFIGERPGFAIFRRFSELNARNLLYLQAELLDVEEELYETEFDDQRDQDLKQLQFSMRGMVMCRYNLENRCWRVKAFIMVAWLPKALELVLDTSCTKRIAGYWRNTVSDALLIPNTWNVLQQSAMHCVSTLYWQRLSKTKFWFNNTSYIAFHARHMAKYEVFENSFATAIYTVTITSKNGYIIPKTQSGVWVLMRRPNMKQTNNEQEHMKEQKQHKRTLSVYLDMSHPILSPTCWEAKLFNDSTYSLVTDCCKKMQSLVAICTEERFWKSSPSISASYSPLYFLLLVSSPSIISLFLSGDWSSLDSGVRHSVSVWHSSHRPIELRFLWLL